MARNRISEGGFVTTKKSIPEEPHEGQGEIEDMYEMPVYATQRDRLKAIRMELDKGPMPPKRLLETVYKAPL
jgi:hypothetical protein